VAVSELGFRLWERLHGHVGWLAAAALVHPAWLLRRRRRRAPGVAWGATVLVTVVGLSGALLYPSYREQVKPVLFERAPAVGWMFERKEHLAVGAVALAWAGLLSHLAVPKATSPAVAEGLERVARRCFMGSAALTVVVAALGTWVASTASF
jgi:hypothetical protein